MSGTGKNAIRYRIVVTKLKGVREDAVKVQGPASNGFVDTWIPRSLLHTLDDLKLDTYEVGSTISIRVVVWKAEELGFA